MLQDVCPLCVEDLDETDKSFQPCPCGYRMCLFCYEKLKLLCNSVCPNCRRAYGSEEAMEYAKKLEAERAQEAAKTRSNAASVSSASTSTSAALSLGSRAPPKPTASHSAARRDALPVPAAKRGSGTQEDSAGQGSSSGLPSGVTWASPSPSSLSRNQSVEMERPALSMDEFSWPSLSAPPQQQQQQQQQQPQRGHGPASQHTSQPQLHGQQQSQGANGSTSTQAAGHQHRHSPSGASEGANSYEQSGADTRRSSSVASSMDRVASSSSLELMSQDPPVTPEQLLQLQHQHQQYQAQHAQVGAASLSSSSSAFPPMPPPGFESASYFGAQVATTVNGLRRAVNVPLSLGTNSVEPYPEAPALLASMQQGVAQGTVSSKEAATQLYALLRQKDQDGQAARTRSAMAATKPPPGFGAPAAHPPAPAAAGAAPQPILAQASGTAAVPTSRPPPPPGFNHLQGTVVQSPPAMSAPIQPPTQQVNDTGFGTSSGPVGRNANGTPRTYSMWSGLPGMDLAASTGLTSLWQNLSASGMSLGGQLGNGVTQPYNPLGLGDQSLSYGATRQSMTTAAPPKPPPPGFGPSAYAGTQAGTTTQQLSSGDAVLGSSFRATHPYQPVGAARYNPLSPPSVIPGVYRPPQLGAGL
ncbi:hypothetical protein VOLCADRAFT_108305 [Volvox carteri f. nagariensis]|uniref:RING-type domain-containing protein n=1 Tax=Volvox carteri f. nagariensis TaxID=3068 RepID=D8UJD3_VOLCA|nr:uncharacterized protein VOLCADRAFT_108305 [Volvox carteri f. nagariensis]EFJ40153.1 hypothetical protein VOLCADRAFT_108305 [Volvox carteri f. nagariensis]|eukprot:XP_002958763.1 hypothetical protein VOLCADRAFT_108305 [Volvox carteri f. nagariensis]